MNLKVRKRIAAEILKCSPKRVWFDAEGLDEINEAITKADLNALIERGIIRRKTSKGISRARARKRILQRRKGRQRGSGSLKGSMGARLPKKENWMKKIRLQRTLLKELKKKGIIDKKSFRMLYAKAKGGLFRSKRHLKLYIEETLGISQPKVERAEENIKKIGQKKRPKQNEKQKDSLLENHNFLKS